MGLNKKECFVPLAMKMEQIQLRTTVEACAKLGIKI